MQFPELQSPFTHAEEYPQEHRHHHSGSSRSNSVSSNDSNNNHGLGMSIRRRRRIDRSQTRALLSLFANNPSPSRDERSRIAAQLGMPDDSVKLWYQNRRAKERIIAAKSKLSENTRNSTVNFWDPGYTVSQPLETNIHLVQLQIGTLLQHTICSNYSFNLDVTSGVISLTWLDETTPCFTWNRLSFSRSNDTVGKIDASTTNVQCARIFLQIHDNYRFEQRHDPNSPWLPSPNQGIFQSSPFEIVLEAELENSRKILALMSSVVATPSVNNGMPVLSEMSTPLFHQMPVFDAFSAANYSLPRSIPEYSQLGLSDPPFLQFQMFPGTGPISKHPQQSGGNIPSLSKHFN